jgi:uncharacterized LabA/DUF88 family protein
MKRVAVLMDGGFVGKAIGAHADPQFQAQRVVRLAEACLDADEEIFRIYYYDCAPYAGKRKDLGGVVVDFQAKRQFQYQTDLLQAIGGKPFTAVRLGEVRFRGWRPRKHITGRLRRQGSITLSPRDFEPNFQQKGVDMRVGLDVATLSIGKLVDRIILVAADSDFIAAMKLARREGMQIALAKLGQPCVAELDKHADLYREPNLTVI